MLLVILLTFSYLRVRFIYRAAAASFPPARAWGHQPLAALFPAPRFRKRLYQIEQFLCRRQDSMQIGEINPSPSPLPHAFIFAMDGILQLFSFAKKRVPASGARVKISAVTLAIYLTPVILIADGPSTDGFNSFTFMGVPVIALACRSPF